MSFELCTYAEPWPPNILKNDLHFFHLPGGREVTICAKQHSATLHYSLRQAPETALLQPASPSSCQIPQCCSRKVRLSLMDEQPVKLKLKDPGMIKIRSFSVSSEEAQPRRRSLVQTLQSISQFQSSCGAPDCLRSTSFISAQLSGPNLSLCVTSEFDPFVLLVPEPIRAGGIGGTWPSATEEL
ncbi:hypothetical protein Y1Q_0004851 [Alligator mississippiensis]|uniref:Uncharacterized protein n=1 Tax=Alligator mississippiensis TaxID=8496 RepID=A0A151NQU5_ALLMI|nr:hypothetical protein Y1Q_0004851 [Alligator mississippiensis]